MTKAKLAVFVQDARLEQDMLEACIPYGYVDGGLCLCDTAAWIDEFVAVVKKDYNLEPFKVESWDHYDE